MGEVRIANVCKYFGTTRIVDDVNLSIGNGEFVVLVGPSGCGKTTLLRMIAGLEDVTSGLVFIDNRNVTDVHPKDRNVAMVFQSYALYPHKTVEENMSFALKLAKRPPAEIKERVHAVAAILGLTELLSRKPAALSGGQRQRVAVGRAIVRNPKVFLFDEPLSNLDAKLRASMRTELVKLHKRLNATMIYVTHDQVEAMTMGDRIVVMNAGNIQQVGTPLEIYDNPRSRFVASFIGSPSMNFMEASVAASGTDVVARIGTQELKLPSDHPAGLAHLVVLGIRPEFFVSNPPPHLPVLTAEVEAVEHLGSETLIDLSIAGVPAVAKFGRNETLHVGMSIKLGVEPRQIFCFDPITGSRVA